MSEVFVVSGNSLAEVNARVAQIVEGIPYQLVGSFSASDMQAEDIDTGDYLISEGRYCIIVRTR